MAQNEIKTNNNIFFLSIDTPGKTGIAETFGFIRWCRWDADYVYNKTTIGEKTKIKRSGKISETADEFPLPILKISRKALIALSKIHNWSSI